MYFGHTSPCKCCPPEGSHQSSHTHTHAHTHVGVSFFEGTPFWLVSKEAKRNTSIWVCPLQRDKPMCLQRPCLPFVSGRRPGGWLPRRGAASCTPCERGGRGCRGCRGCGRCRAVMGFLDPGKGWSGCLTLGRFRANYRASSEGL